MVANRPTVLITDYAWPTIDVEKGVLHEVADIIPAPDTRESTLMSLAEDADAILFNWAQVSEGVVRAATKCKILSRYGVGIDNIPVDLATDLGILVTNIPDYCMEEVTDHAMGLLLTLNRRIFQFDALVRDGHADSMDLSVNVLQLRGHKLGLVGIGRIGGLMISKAQAFGLDVIAYDPYVSEEQAEAMNVRKVELSELAKESDFISLHAPLTPETKWVVDEKFLQSMKPTAFLVNVARGPLVKTDAIVQALRENWIAGAALDVLEEEPVPADHPLIDLDNVILTPHSAFFSQQSIRELAFRCANQVKDVLQGKTPENVRNSDVLSNARATLR